MIGIECIAAYTMRPLLSLAISDIGTEPSEAEKHLDHYFKRAKEWNAILLIDEADIYMERRETQDLTRNSLVSGIPIVSFCLHLTHIILQYHRILNMFPQASSVRWKTARVSSF